MLLFFLFSLFLPTPIYADAFDETHDSVDSLLRHSISFWVDSLPESSLEAGGISYDTTAVVGTSPKEDPPCLSANFLLGTDGFTRRFGSYDNIVGPPRTKILLVYNYFNRSGHDINVSKIVVPFSKSNPENGNLCNILEFETEPPVMSMIEVLYKGDVVRRRGYLKEYPGFDFPVVKKVIWYSILETLTIKDPLELSTPEIKAVPQGFLVSFIIANNSEELLENLVFEYGNLSKVFNLNPHSKYKVEYIAGDDPHVGTFTITNNNKHTECIAYAWGPPYNPNDNDSANVFTYRDDGGWFLGSYSTRFEDAYCITRSEYKITSEDLWYENLGANGNIDEDIFIWELPYTAKRLD